MQLEEFLQKNNIMLPGSLLYLCKEGLSLMKKSIDPLHRDDHILRMLDSLNSLLKYNPQINKIVNLEVLLPAICWHDTWRSKKFHTNKSAFLYTTFFDGLGSAKLFRRQARKLMIDKKLIKEVAYTIRKHSAVQLLSLSTTTAKILKELDLLDQWSEERLKIIEETFLIPKKLSPRIIKIAKFYFDHYMIRTHQSAFYLPWIKKEFKLRKQPYIHQVQRLADQYS